MTLTRIGSPQAPSWDPCREPALLLYSLLRGMARSCHSPMSVVQVQKKVCHFEFLEVTATGTPGLRLMHPVTCPGAWLETTKGTTSPDRTNFPPASGPVAEGAGHCLVSCVISTSMSDANRELMDFSIFGAARG